MEEENFYELYELYLDDEMVFEKIESDEQEEIYEIKPENYDSKSPFTKEEAISINEYVNKFLNIGSDAHKLLHSGLKDLKCPYVVGVSNDFANKNPELVKQGYLLLVIDYHNNRGTYINPLFLKSLVNNYEHFKEYNWIKKQKIKDLSELKYHYGKYKELETRVDLNERFYDLIDELKKSKKVEEIKKFEQNSGGMKK